MGRAPATVAAVSASPRLKAARSPIHGRGLFAVDAVPRRMKLGELGGVLRRLPEARAAMRGRRRIHLVELDRRWGLDCTRGNLFRHLNHCCAANCYLRVVARRVEIYSRGAIPAGAELTVDYRATPHPGGMACRCGAPRCRGRL
jgi:SET domain-containing protein